MCPPQPGPPKDQERDAGRREEKFASSHGPCSIARKLQAAAFVALALSSIAPAAFGQATFEWSVLYGNAPLTDLNIATEAAVDSLGNIYTAARRSGSTGFYDLEVAKHDAGGSMLWSRRFDTGAAISELCSGLALAPNGDVCLAGWRHRDQTDLIAVRYDSNGAILHSTIFSGAPGPGNDAAGAVAVDAQSNMIVGGTVTDALGNTSVLLQSYSPLGVLNWETRDDLSPGHWEGCQGLVVQANGDIFAAGWLEAAADREAWIAKYSANGVRQWSRVFPGSPTVQESFTVLASDHQGGVVAGGNQAQPAGLGNWTSAGWVVRCDGGGNYLWSEVAPGGGHYYVTQDVLVDQGGVCWALHWDVSGIAFTSPSTIARISPSGVPLSSVPLPGYGSALALGNAGQVYFCAEEPGGLQGNSAALTQLDSSGAVNWRRTYASPGLSSGAIGLQLAPQSRVVLHGYSKVVGTTGSWALVAQFDIGESPEGYCGGKVNSLGCAPRVAFTGLARASSSSGFTVRIENVLNQKPSLFLYSLQGAAALPFGGGLLCVDSPVRRTAGVSSGGSPPPGLDCSGTAAIDMNAFAHGSLGGTPAPALLTAGTRVWIQAWGRDPGFTPPGDVSLSGGLSYMVLP
ncbi:MAG: hypothetical protein IPK67_00445 [Planctomycetes bacterium]|nr:hypothetical protein [Planctomycetota bacterium]